MNKLLLHHYYAAGDLRDVSDYHHDGVPHGVARGVDGFRHSLAFDGAGSWIQVPWSPAMDPIMSLRMRVTFHVAGEAPSRRMTDRRIIDAHGSFNLSVSSHIVLEVFDRNGESYVCPSDEIIDHEGWYTADVFLDGISQAKLFLQGREVASNSVPGPVRPIGPAGIAIGRSIDGYAGPFLGHISEIEMYKYDPEPEVKRFLAAPCVDIKATAKLVETALSRGKPAGLVAWAQDLFDVGIAASRALRGDDRAGAERTMQDEHALMEALYARDPARFREALARLTARARGLDGETLRALAGRLESLGTGLPLDAAEQTELARALCVEGYVPGAQPAKQTETKSEIVLTHG